MNIENIVSQIIADKGFIPVDQFIKICLLCPEIGYYTRVNPIKKDFVTSTEITDAFGKTIAGFILEKILNIQGYTKINIVEFGPGSGIFMADIAQYVSKFCKMTNRIDIAKIEFTLIEQSPILQKLQRNTLCNLTDCNFVFEADVLEYLDRKSEINDEVLIFISNEFFDALPVESMVFDGSKWKNIVVIKDENHFNFAHAKDVAISPYYGNTGFKNGDVVEFPRSGVEILNHALAILKRTQGIFLTFDYGYTQNSFKSTLQGICNGRKSNILENLGQTDITHLVDFELFGKVAFANGFTPQILTQGTFLKDNGMMNFMSDFSKNAIDRITTDMENFHAFYCLQ